MKKRHAKSKMYKYIKKQKGKCLRMFLEKATNELIWPKKNPAKMLQ